MIEKELSREKCELGAWRVRSTAQVALEDLCCLP